MEEFWRTPPGVLHDLLREAVRAGRSSAKRVIRAETPDQIPGL